MITKIIKVFTDYCGPCKQLARELEDISIPVEEINADEDTEFSESHNIKSVPVLIFMDNDKEIYRHTGLMTRESIENKIETLNSNGTC